MWIRPDRGWSEGVSKTWRRRDDCDPVTEPCDRADATAPAPWAQWMRKIFRVPFQSEVEPFWLHAPLSNSHRNERGPASNALSSSLNPSMVSTLQIVHCRHNLPQTKRASHTVCHLPSSKSFLWDMSPLLALQNTSLCALIHSSCITKTWWQKMTKELERGTFPSNVTRPMLC